MEATVDGTSDTQRNPFKNIELKKIILPTIIFLIISAVFINYAWNKSVKTKEDNAIKFAQTFEAGIHKSLIHELTGDSSDLNKTAYKEIKNSLIRLVKYNDEIRFAYIFIEKDNKIYILADSEVDGSKDYSPPGQEYTEADIEIFEVFNTGQTKIINPVNDRWGSWVSVLVPMKSIDTGEIVAVFGIDYPVENWNNQSRARTMQVSIVMFCLLIILIMLNIAYYQYIQITDEKTKLFILDDKLKKSESLFKAIFDQASVGIAIGHNNRYYIANENDININPMYEKITGRTIEELKTTKWPEITHPDDLTMDMELFNKFKSGEIDSYEIEKRYIKPDNTEIWINKKISSLMIDNLERYNHLCIIEDISKRKEIEKELYESERSKAVLLNNLPGMAYRCNYDREWTMQFVSAGFYELTGYEPESLLYNKELSFNDLILPKYRETLYTEWERIVQHRLPFRYEYEIMTADNKTKWVMEMGQAIYDTNDNVEALEGIIIDISEQKEKEAQIQYMIDHDYMTNLHNRKYFEEYMADIDNRNCVPVSIIYVDLNGVRMINDAFGYSEGDNIIIKASEILRGSIRQSDFLARIGGDEFVIILLNTDNEEAHEIISNIENACLNYNNKNKTKLFEINFSIGCATKENSDDSIFNAAKIADEDLRNKMLLNRKSSHSHIITSMLATVYEKSQETEEHARRLGDVSRRIGELLNLSSKSLSELELLAMLHDIGKVGIDERVLNKTSGLTENEWAIMKRHPEIGYRIAKSSSDLEPIADYILSHHERWDGKGYPRGLKGEEIPLLSRIIAIADAYDAMTQDRVYRKALIQEDALNEIQKNAGTQFDPDIAKSFIENIYKLNND